jgi:prephenate dehydratase
LLRIAIQGELGSFSHEAALRMAEAIRGRASGQDATIVPCAVSADVFRMVVASTVDAAVIPIENSLAGPVVEHYDLLLHEPVGIERESLLRIRHNLIAAPQSALHSPALQSPIESLDKVFSHPVALAQCRRFFDLHPGIHPVPYYDTAGSVRHILESGDLRAGAIASRQAAAQYGGKILLADIEDNPANFTRFFLLRRSELVTTDPQADKVSLAFLVENRPGTLVEALQVFVRLGTNLTKIESRPVVGRPWQYVFFVDYQLSRSSTADAILEALQSSCSMVRELGRYRSAAVDVCQV